MRVELMRHWKILYLIPAMNAWPTEYYPLVLAILMEDREVASIGQFDARQKRLLARAVKKGDLSQSREAGPFPKLKVCYAAPGYDFQRSRAAHLAELQRLAAIDARGPKCKALSSAERN
jgi:hypothetical protein